MRLQLLSKINEQLASVFQRQRQRITQH